MMAFGEDSELASNKKIIKSLETIFLLHAEHELNCSTAAMRHMTSALADVYSSLSGSVTALFGPRQSGVCELVIRMLEEIKTVENVPSFIEKVKRKERTLAGFGHRVYRNNDPRVDIIRHVADDVYDIVGREQLIEVAFELERIARTDAYFITRKLQPNIDFYSGCIFKAMGFPPEFFSVLYALPRFTGWLAHWNEFIQDPENRVVRPSQLYMGERSRNFKNINDRGDAEIIASYKCRE